VGLWRTLCQCPERKSGTGCSEEIGYLWTRIRRVVVSVKSSDLAWENSSGAIAFIAVSSDGSKKKQKTDAAPHALDVGNSNGAMLSMSSDFVLGTGSPMSLGGPVLLGKTVSCRGKAVTYLSRSRSRSRENLRNAE